MTAMKKNKSIKTLKFDCENILGYLIFHSLLIRATDAKCGVEGAKAIAAMLVKNDTLIELDLYGMTNINIATNQIDLLFLKAISLAMMAPL